MSGANLPLLPPSVEIPGSHPALTHTHTHTRTHTLLHSAFNKPTFTERHVRVVARHPRARVHAHTHSLPIPSTFCEQSQHHQWPQPQAPRCPRRRLSLPCAAPRLGGTFCPASPAPATASRQIPGLRDGARVQPESPRNRAAAEFRATARVPAGPRAPRATGSAPRHRVCTLPPAARKIPAPPTGQARPAAPASPDSRSSKAPRDPARAPPARSPRSGRARSPGFTHARTDTHPPFPRPGTHTCAPRGMPGSSRIPGGSRRPARVSHCPDPVGGCPCSPCSPGKPSRAALTVRRNWISSSPSPPSAMAPRLLAGAGSRAPRSPAALAAAAPRAVSAAAAARSRGREGAAAAGRRAPGGPRLQSGGGGAGGGGRGGSLPAPHCAGGGRPGPEDEGRRPRNPAAPASRVRPAAGRLLRPGSSERVRGARGAALSAAVGAGTGGGRAGGEELAGSPLLQVIRSPLLGAAKLEAQRRLLAVPGIAAEARPTSGQPSTCALLFPWAPAPAPSDLRNLGSAFLSPGKGYRGNFHSTSDRRQESSFTRMPGVGHLQIKVTQHMVF